jgi:hypothetical protein
MTDIATIETVRHWCGVALRLHSQQRWGCKVAQRRRRRFTATHKTRRMQEAQCCAGQMPRPAALSATHRHGLHQLSAAMQAIGAATWSRGTGSQRCNMNAVNPGFLRSGVCRWCRCCCHCRCLDQTHPRTLSSSGQPATFRGEGCSRVSPCGVGTVLRCSPKTQCSRPKFSPPIGLASAESVGGTAVPALDRAAPVLAEGLIPLGSLSLVSRRLTTTRHNTTQHDRTLPRPIFDREAMSLV